MPFSSSPGLPLAGVVPLADDEFAFHSWCLARCRPVFIAMWLTFVAFVVDVLNKNGVNRTNSP
jgi:hypothetical protein